MTPDERELRRALEARSGPARPEFHARISDAIMDRGQPRHELQRTIGVAVAVVLTIAIVVALVLIRQPHPQSSVPGGRASSARVSSPSPTQAVPGVLDSAAGKIAMPTTAYLSEPNDTVLWALVANQYLFRSSDRGAHWKQMPMPPATGIIDSISFVDAQRGWVLITSSPATQCQAEAAGVWATSDGGATWTDLGAHGMADAQCKASISFSDAQHGFVAAWDQNHPPVIYRSSDGGLTWTPSRGLPDPPGFTSSAGGVELQAGLVRAFGDVLLVPAFAYQNGGVVQYVFESTDGGATWRYAASGGASPGDGTPVAFITVDHWLQLGVGPGQSLETTDGGRTWHASAGDYEQAAGVAPQVVFSGNVGYATVRGGIQLSTDGGLHWSIVTGRFV